MAQARQQAGWPIRLWLQPSLRVQLDGDNFASQAGATFALARSLRYYRDGRGTAVATQAILSLLLETALDGELRVPRPHRRLSIAVELRFAGLCHSRTRSSGEADDLLKQADQLLNYLRQQQRPMVRSSSRSTQPHHQRSEIDAEHAGSALQGVIRSQKLRRPSGNSTCSARRAHSISRNAAKQEPRHRLHAHAGLCRVVCAYERPGLQGRGLRDERLVAHVAISGRPRLGPQHWSGGFKRFRDGKIEFAVPDISSALCAGSLVEACRVARHAGDLPRLQRYERALLDSLQFLMSLQYTPAKTQHFVDPFRPSVLGAFHASHQDGNLRIDYTQHALCAMVQYLDAVIE